MENDEWKIAVDKMFNVTHWQYIHISSVYNCVYKFFGDSWYNLNLNIATVMASGVFSVTIMFGLMLYSIWE